MMFMTEELSQHFMKILRILCGILKRNNMDGYVQVQQGLWHRVSNLDSLKICKRK